MPVKWQFTERSSGKPQMMKVLQEQIQTASGGKCSLDEIAMNGIAILGGTNDTFFISEAGLKAYCKKWGPNSKQPLPAWLVPILWRFLFEDYEFKAWR